MSHRRTEGQAMTNRQLSRLALVAAGFALALSSVQPALSCHRYKEWRYPWRQECAARQEHARMRVVLSDDELRAAAMPKLRAELDALVNGEQRE